MSTIELKKEIAPLDGSYLLKIDLGFEYDDQVSETEKRDELFENLVFDQIHRGLKKAIKVYKENALPEKYIEGQVYVAHNHFPQDVWGMFDLRNDDIHLDADCISGISPISGAFLIGHEIGHKIKKYRKVEPLLFEIAQFLGISALGREKILEELFADECGKIASGSLIGEQYLRVPIEEGKRKEIHRKILSYVSQ